jgi:hypothetical protein
MPTVLTLSMISSDVYGGSGAAVLGYKRLDHQVFNGRHATASSFYGAAYAGGAVGVVAFRGSQEREDWLDADVSIGAGNLPIDQVGDAFAFFNRAREVLVKQGAKRVVVTGHSLGGGLTQVVAGRVKSSPVIGVTFNAPGMAGLRSQVHITTANSPNVFNYRAERDPVSRYGQHIGHAPVSVAGGGMHPLGPLITALAACGTGSIRH